jgi:hypothetical protein
MSNNRLTSPLMDDLRNLKKDYHLYQSKPTAELIKIIKDLIYNSAAASSSSSDSKERDAIIKKVEQDFSACDSKIDGYIRASSKDLSNLIKVFNEIAKKIDASREKVSHNREALKQCKILLQSKRDDVRRLWLDWCEQKFYYENISKLKQLYVAGENVRSLCQQKCYLEAAELIASSSQLLANDFREITGLNEIKRQIDDERIKLEHFLYLELTDQLYTVVTKSMLETGNLLLPSRETSFKRRFRHHNTANNSSSSTTNSNKEDHSLNESALKQISFETTIEKLVQAASKLNSSEANINIIEKMINDINKNITNQLIQMINATSTHVLESNLIDNSKFNSSSTTRYRQSIENNPKFLAQLIDLTYEQFKISAKSYRHFIEYASKINATKYQSNVIWTCIQNVMITLLEEYLDIRQLGQNYLTNINDLDKMDVNSFFVRKKMFGFNETTTTTTTTNLQTNTNNQIMSSSGNFDTAPASNQSNNHIFAFKNSSHAMSITKYNREKNNEAYFDDHYLNQSGDASSTDDNRGGAGGAGNGGSDEHKLTLNNEHRVFKILVCQPDHRNITTIFSLMEHICKDIAEEVRVQPTVPQTSGGIAGMMNEFLKPELLLDPFLSNFILKTFISNSVESIKENARIHNSAIDGGKFEITKQLIPLAKQRELGLNKPILQNIYLVHQSCVDLFNLIKDMNSYASEFSRAMHSLIEKHYDYCNRLFLSIVTNSLLPAATTNDSSNNNATANNLANENYVYSMVWVLDEGIKKYFKQLPAFSAAIKGLILIFIGIKLFLSQYSETPEL